MIIERVRKILQKPPSYVIKRIGMEVGRQTDRWRAPARARKISTAVILRELGAATVAELWNRLADRPYATVTRTIDKADYDLLCTGDSQRILHAADLALAHNVDLLGSGPTSLGSTIDWSMDFKTGISWPNQFYGSYDYNNPELPSDVKVPWELSRLQWALPLGQAYALTGDDKYAEATKLILSNWIDANPYAFSINWTCTMEVALRIMSWTWLFSIFAKSASWQEQKFQSKFLHMLYLHGDFTEHHLEHSDVNGNHYASDAAGLVFAGLFFDCGNRASRWSDLGWKILTSEIDLQILSDGVDFEASVPYHRLVLELFLLPAIYRKRAGLGVSAAYRDKLVKMAHFTVAYSREDGGSPLVGDADDGRALPMGGQALSDHRYLVGLIGHTWDDDLLQYSAGPVSEAYWILGREAAHLIEAVDTAHSSSQAFKESGFYVMRNPAGDHIFIDCGILGLSGRGGHGHNDALSFEAALCGIPLISDCGAYVYTASYKERNNFRSTAYHNTPQIGGEEINRYVHPDLIWSLKDDARPEVREWKCSEAEDVFVGSHSGYLRFPEPVTPVRTITLRHDHHQLIVQDSFSGATSLPIRVPLHLSSGVEAQQRDSSSALLKSGDDIFVVTWSDPAQWTFSIEPARISPSYGCLLPSQQLVWNAASGTPSLRVEIAPLKDISRYA